MAGVKISPAFGSVPCGAMTVIGVSTLPPRGESNEQVKLTYQIKKIRRKN